MSVNSPSIIQPSAPGLTFDPVAVVNKSVMFRNLKNLLFGTAYYWWLRDICRKFMCAIDDAGNDHNPVLTEGLQFPHSEDAGDFWYGGHLAAASSFTRPIVIVANPRSVIICTLLDSGADYISPPANPRWKTLASKEWLSHRAVYCDARLPDAAAAHLAQEGIKVKSTDCLFPGLCQSNVDVDLPEHFLQPFRQLQSAGDFQLLRDILKLPNGETNIHLWELMQLLQLSIQP